MYKNCEICSFRNPKAAVTAVIIKNKKILLTKRNESPFKNMWDLPGGYMNEKETPKNAIRRELMEELNALVVRAKMLDFFYGYAFWKRKKFPILSIAFLVDLSPSVFKFNNENSQVGWFSRYGLPRNIAFDSNKEIINYVKKNRLI